METTPGEAALENSPAGLVVAHRLLRSGVSCIVLERLSSEALSLRAKAGMLEHRTVQALARIEAYFTNKKDGE